MRGNRAESTDDIALVDRHGSIKEKQTSITGKHSLFGFSFSNPSSSSTSTSPSSSHLERGSNIHNISRIDKARINAPFIMGTIIKKQSVLTICINKHGERKDKTVSIV